MGIYNFDQSQKFTSTDLSSDMRSDADKYNPPQSQYDHDAPEIKQAENLALESIRIAGIPVYIIARTEDEKYDKVWTEDTDPTYHSPIEVKAYLKPQPPEVVLSAFGIDAEHKQELRFSRMEILELLGKRLLRAGDLIKIPTNHMITEASLFRIVHVTDSGNYRFRYLYLDVDVVAENKDQSFMPVNE